MLSFEMNDVLAAVREASQLGKQLQGNCRAELKPDNTFVTCLLYTSDAADE